MQFLLKVLQGNIIGIEGDDQFVVPFDRQPYHHERVPSFSFDNSGGTSVLDRHYYHTPQEYIVETKETTIKIHVFTGNVDDDDKICSTIDKLLFQSLTDHYFHCMNYEEGYCKSFSEPTPCKAVSNKIKFRSAKNQCPYPDELGYEGALSHYNIIRESVSIEDPFSIDYLDVKAPVIHSVINVNMNYKEWKYIGGLVAEKVYVRNGEDYREV